MSLHLHLADRTDRLADELAGLLATPLDDPFAEEVVVVPARGVERWLTQRLSHHLGVGARGGDGVCAGVRFLSPRSLVAMLTGTDHDDPWDPDRLVWPLLEAIDASLDEAWCATLANHLGHGVSGDDGDLRRDRRYSVARRLAGLFASYAVQRPTLIGEWRSGQSTDGTGEPLAEDLAWQPELWRRLVTRVGAPPPDERHAATITAIRAGAPLALPDRLSLFGHTRLPRTEIELLRAVGEVRDVHLWLPQASHTLWESLVPVVAAGPVRRGDDESGALVRNPLLSSLGRDSRELQRSLAGIPVEPGPVVELVETNPQTLLGWLQSDLRRDEVSPVPDAARVLDPADRSVQVHACHGAARQVDVLREVLVGLLQDDPTLEPRDILVMCPDIEGYAPLFQAGFGLAGVVSTTPTTGNGSTTGGGSVGGAAHPAHSLRVRLADRGLMSTNPLLAVAAQLVEIAGGRATATEVLDLASAAPVRFRFGFGDDELATITNWVEESGIRWGLNEDLRAPYKLEKFDQNTWRSGLDRILLGVAMAEEDGRWLGATLPLDDVASGAVDLAGRLAEYVDRLETCVLRLRDSRALSEWVDALHDGVLAVTGVPLPDAWQVAQFERELATVAEASRGDGTELRLADLRTMLELRLQGRPTRANFRSGTLTVCTMVPMRSVPHRVVCLIGLDDGVFPRSTAVDGDDVLARDPMTGERDARSEDRQLLLDAILATTDKLVITYTGANEHTGQPRPPAVPLGELLDALDLTAAGDVRRQVLVKHPLQSFDTRNFIDGALAPGGPFAFDRTGLAGARAAVGTRTPKPVFLPAPLAGEVSPDVSLADLQAFFAHPARAFLRQRLDVGVSDDYEEIDDAMPVELNALMSWAIGDRVLRQAIDGADAQSVFSAELYRGELPPGLLGERLLKAEVAERVGALLHHSAALREFERRAVDVTVDLGNGRRLTGTVPDVRRNRIVRIHYANLSAKHRLTSWVDLLALSAGLPDMSWTASTVGWHRTKTPQESLMGPLDHTALGHLRDLVDLFDRGMAAPVPLPVKTAFAWADKVRVHSSPTYGARNAWESGQFPGEQDDAHHVRVYGAHAPLGVLLGQPLAGEDWNSEQTRLGQYALRLWQPIFDHERVG
ncbi:MAG: recC [Marmoricola sp.]|nr:recC [Marmoricola sp.]